MASLSICHWDKISFNSCLTKFFDHQHARKEDSRSKSRELLQFLYHFLWGGEMPFIKSHPSVENSTFINPFLALKTNCIRIECNSL